MESLFIDDGYTATKTIARVPGLYPDLKITYRPALAKERHAYRLKANTIDPVVIDGAEVELILRFLSTINGQQLDKEKVGKLKPAIRSQICDLILGYTPEDEKESAVNLPLASG